MDRPCAGCFDSVPRRRRAVKRTAPLKRTGSLKRSRLKAGRRQPISQQHRRRFDAIQQIGCVACLLDGRPGEPCDIHHVLRGGKRLGHDHTIGLCPHHHRGLPRDGLTAQETAALLGPSMAREPRAFAAAYGSQEALLAMQDRLLGDIGGCRWLP